MYVYINSEPGLYTVGHYAPDGKFVPESDHDSVAAAAARVAELNGGGREEPAAPGTPALRDWFAGQALAGFCAADATEFRSVSAAAFAELAYEYADAMLAARGAKK